MIDRPCTLYFIPACDMTPEFRGRRVKVIYIWTLSSIADRLFEKSWVHISLLLITHCPLWDVAHLEVPLLDMMMLCREAIYLSLRRYVTNALGCSQAPIYFIFQFIRLMTGASQILSVFPHLWEWIDLLYLSYCLSSSGLQDNSNTSVCQCLVFIITTIILAFHAMDINILYISFCYIFYYKNFYLFFLFQLLVK